MENITDLRGYWLKDFEPYFNMLPPEDPPPPRRTGSGPTEPPSSSPPSGERNTEENPNSSVPSPSYGVSGASGAHFVSPLESGNKAHHFQNEGSEISKLEVVVKEFRINSFQELTTCCRLLYRGGSYYSSLGSAGLFLRSYPSRAAAFSRHRDVLSLGRKLFTAALSSIRLFDRPAEQESCPPMGERFEEMRSAYCPG